MNLALASWTPRAHPLYYDALLQSEGCQDINGNVVFASQPFTRVCIFEHNDDSLIFNRLDTVAYATGPATAGGARPWATTWAAWVGTSGIRIAKVPIVTPPANTTGSASIFYPTTKPTKVSIGFTAEGQLALAIQKTETGIEIKWHAANGTTVNTAVFVGKYPSLFQNGLLYHSDDIGEEDLVLYYLRPEVPRTIFARFERESFATEHVINDTLQFIPTKLIGSWTQGGKQTLYARDIFGRDVTLYSDFYSTSLDGDKLALALSIQSASYFASAVESAPPADELTLALSIVSARYNSPIKSPASSLSGDSATLTVGIVSARYS